MRKKENVRSISMQKLFGREVGAPGSTATNVMKGVCKDVHIPANFNPTHLHPKLSKSVVLNLVTMTFITTITRLEMLTKINCFETGIFFSILFFKVVLN